MYESLSCFFAAATVTTPLALGYHPEDARRVRDVFNIFLSLDVDISIVVYPWYTFGIALPICPLPRILRPIRNSR